MPANWLDFKDYYVLLLFLSSQVLAAVPSEGEVDATYPGMRDPKPKSNPLPAWIW